MGIKGVGGRRHDDSSGGGCYSKSSGALNVTV